jgi:hypothetical protein
MLLFPDARAGHVCEMKTRSTTPAQPDEHEVTKNLAEHSKEEKRKQNKF